MKHTMEGPAQSWKNCSLHECINDPYKAKRKLPEPAFCPVCQAVFDDGRWQWAKSRPLDAVEETCPACHRIRDHYPAGVLTLSGAFALAHKDEILHLARHQEREENAEHPLHRIMTVEDHPDRVVIHTTDIHLPHRIGQALHHAYRGDLEVQYDREGYSTRAHWTRE